MSHLTRRAALAAGASLPLAAPFLARAAAAPIPLGMLTPLTGAGGAYGPDMAKAMLAVAASVNAGGGVLGRQVNMIGEDDQTNPDAGVRAARKLIDVDRVPAILGTWASTVTTAVAPLCWQSKTMLFTVSGADSITKLPHHGYIIRTQPTTFLQATRLGEFMAAQGAKRVFSLAVQSPFAADTYTRLSAVLKAHGAATIGQVVYDGAKTSFRSEITRALAAKPDAMLLNSYLPDLTVLLKELYQEGYKGKLYTPAYAANSKLLAALPAAATNGLMTWAPSPDLTSPAYADVKKALGHDPDPYSAQTHDHATLAILAMAAGKAATGPTIHDWVRRVGDPKGIKVTSAVEGLRLLGEKQSIHYLGASGPCQFLPSGDVASAKFRFDVIENKVPRMLSLS